MAGLRTDVELGYEDALASVDRIGSGLDDVVARFTEGIATALDTASSTTIAPQVDTSALEAGLAEALAQVQDVVVPVGADTATAEADVAALEAGVATEQLTLPLDVDTGPATAQVEGLVQTIDAEQPTIQVDADTSQAEDAAQNLSSDLEDVGTSATGATSAVGGFSDSNAVLAGTMGLASGSGSGLTDVLKGVDAGTVGAVGGIAALAGGIGILYERGLDGVSVGQRFNLIVGDMADRVNQVNVGDLNVGLDDLAHKLGTTDENLRGASASIFQFAVNGGAGREQAALFTNQIDALAARAVALNPALGSVGDVADSLSARISRGGRFAASYGLSLSAAEINARALGETGKTSASDLTIQEKAFAAAEIASDRYGNTLNTTITEGSKNAAFEQRNLKVAVQEAEEAAGKQIVVPILDLFRAGLPIVTAIITPLGELAHAVIPPLASALGFIGPVLGPVLTGFAAMTVASKVLDLALGLPLLGAQKLIEVMPLAAETTVTAEEGIAAASGALDAALGPVGLIAGALAIGASAFGLFGDGASESTQKVDDFASSLENANGKLDETATKAARGILEERNQMDDLARSGLSLNRVLDATSRTSASQRSTLEDLEHVTHQVAIANGNNTAALDSSGHSLAELRSQQQQYIARLRETNPALASVAAAVLKDNAANEGFVGTLRDLSQTSADTTRKLHDRAAAGATDASISKQQADASTQEADARKKATDAIDAYKQALDDLVSPQLDVTSAQLHLAEAGDKVAAAYAQQVDDSHPLNVVLNDQRGALIDNVKAAEDLATATYKQVYATQGQQAAQTAADGVMHNFATTLRDQLTGAYGLSTDAANALLDQLGLTQSVADPAAATLQFLADHADELQARAIAASFGYGGAMGKIKDDTASNTSAAATTMGQNGADIVAKAALAGAGSSDQFGAGVAGMPGHAANATSDSGGVIAGLTGPGGQVYGQAYSAGSSVGEAFGAGLVAGMDTMLGDVIAEAATLVVEAEQAARDQARSKSPSLLFADLGADLAAGVAVGLAGGTSAVTGAARSVITSAARAAQVAPQAGAAPGLGAGIGTVARGAAGASVVVHNHLHVRADASTPQHVIKRQADEYGEAVGAATVRAVIGAL